MTFPSEDRGSFTAQDLLGLANRRLGDGSLIHAPKGRVFAGPGMHAFCSLCERPINAGEMEYEFDPIAIDASSDHLHFHGPCYFAWLQACTAFSSSYHSA